MQASTKARILISGMGIAGPTLAYWLKRYGFEPTVVERAAGPRLGGYIIDFWGKGYDIAGRMGLLPGLRSEGYFPKEVRLVDASGRRTGGFSADVFKRITRDRYVSLSRNTLAAALLGAVAGVETQWNDAIARLTDAGDRVTATFQSGASRDFELVIGADGLHSRTRRLVFSEAQLLERYLGYKVAAFQISGYQPRDEDVYLGYAEPGRQVARFAMHNDQTLFLFVWRDADPRTDGVDARAALRKEFGSSSWECPRILGMMEACDDIYFDRVSQIRMPAWTKGRAALVGDAAYCPSLLAGEGAALAMIGAYVLAGELAVAKGDHGVAFARYEAVLRQFVEQKQKAAASFASSFVPRSRFGIWMRSLVTKAFAVPFVADLTLGASVRDPVQLPDYEQLLGVGANEQTARAC